MTVAPLLLLLLFVLPPYTFEQQQQHLSSTVERAALFSLRSSLGLRRKDWPRDADPCSWRGVSCRNNGHVVGINLSELKRTRLGQRNPQFSVGGLSNLTFLTTFNSSTFPLPGPIPSWFGPLTLPSLTVLDLHSSSIVGSVPFTIGNLSNLRHLDLSQNSLFGTFPEFLSRLTSLTFLDLSDNSFTGPIPPSLSSLRHLTRLHLSGNLLTGFISPALGSFPNLTSLDLSNNNLSGSIPPQLGKLRNLTNLDLGFNSLFGVLPQDLQNLQHLQSLALQRNFLEGPLSREISSLSRLRSLHLSHNNFSGFPFTTLSLLPEMHFLDASHNNFTGRFSLPSISNVSNIAKHRVFNVSHNQLYGSLVLSQLGSFELLDLSYNYMEGRINNQQGKLNVSLNTNCLQNVPRQRSFRDCRLFYASKGLHFNETIANGNGTTPHQNTKNKKLHLWLILGIVIGGLIFVILLALAIFLVCRMLGRAPHSANRGAQEAAPADTPTSPGTEINFSNLGQAFTYDQLVQATADFGDYNLIKHGHSGDLYLGMMEGGISVIVKRVDMQASKKDMLMVELDVFSRVSHDRLIRLLGHCMDQENHKFLVYKYMPNSDLSNAMYRKTSQGNDGLQSLDWITRLKIAIGVAEALNYLHHECSPQLVHRDVQASSVLLDDKFEVRLGSLSEVCTQEGDTHPNVITKFLRLPQRSAHSSVSASSVCAFDVYCFGRVLLELVTGKLGVSGSDNENINEWLEQTLSCINIYEKELIMKIIDPSLIVDEDLLEEVWAMAVVAKSCLNPKASRRPLTKYILKALENPLKVVRGENSAGSARLKAASSRGSWNAALFGSWHHSSSDMVAPGPSRDRNGSGHKQLGFERVGRVSSTGASGEDLSSSNKRLSRDIFPEPDMGARPEASQGEMEE